MFSITPSFTPGSCVNYPDRWYHPSRPCKNLTRPIAEGAGGGCFSRSSLKPPPEQGASALIGAIIRRGRRREIWISG